MQVSLTTIKYRKRRFLVSQVDRYFSPALPQRLCGFSCCKKMRKSEAPLWVKVLALICFTSHPATAGRDKESGIDAPQFP
jgi:hypothetical protein